MSKKIRRTKQVGQDLIDIYGYIYRDSPRSAERVFNAIERNIKALLDMPGVGRRWESPDPRLEGMRVAVVTPYRNCLIFFRAVAEGIEVLRVIHGARELQRVVDEIELDFEEG